ncbi:RNA polymerase-binding protein RbpA [Gulosibacter macacae]|uniref:RNA polymerase-binding protein RbpA n=1 Tax=Gulosibacter macacae TaxID=2488791 RepID=A0A3P3VXF4_9MICO|nr:RNA polymerase-binding protein RbpA [Gulosibacter macacae]RRJ87164.1 RNA polymerase-binding protein RbpA [Gulosibacter macacae]
MADRSLRGMRLGAQSLQSDEGVVLVDHQYRTYQTEAGERFVVTFAADAEAPEVWDSPKTGDEGRLLDDEGDLVPYEAPEQKPQRTHWDMLLERRTREELEEVLQIRLDYLRERRGTAERREPTAGKPQTTGRADEAPIVHDIAGRPRAQTAAEKAAAAKAAKAAKSTAAKK